MATSEWIDAAARVDKPSIGGGMVSNYQHVLTMARADEKREALDRVLAGRAVQRLGGGEAGELLAMLGLEAPSEPAPTGPEPAGWKECRDCGKERHLSQFPPRATRKDGRDSYCRACHRKRKAERAAAVAS